ncbi:hypothetical protein PR202_gb17677 [Eleusine coracana subsp. coracana]|uniref:NAD-dependent epimerase/dehydratase domain-containing protein n=1 Tax=Eleusine coracana subsp. coracana TaxID=191504 RepID=A0AAV5F3I1_ELECO|nr:hypothetical protein PR202_gb17677 [Eleusine coracana subsp. coracana]
MTFVDGDDTAAAAPGRGQTVCVTGAGGYIGSWIVKLLLDRGYTVRGTVRNPVPLFSVYAQEEMVEPAVRGTRHVIDAAAESGTVRRVVLTSSIGAVAMDPNRAPDAIVDESCWSDLEFCKKTKNWYCYGKTVAEQAAWEAAAARGVDLVVVNPVLVQGPALQPSVNASLMHVLKYLNGSAKTFANAVQAYVHVRDAADAHVRVFEAPAAAGRYLCADSVLHREDVVRILRKFFPEYPVPDRCSDEVNPRKQLYKVSNQRLRDLGMEFTPAAQALYDTVVCFQEKGILPVVPPSSPEKPAP